MKTILFTVLGGLLLLWAGIGALLKWIKPIEQKHFLWVGGYASLVTVVLLFLVINTSMTQQKAALEGTQTLLSEQVDNFRIRLGEITEKLMGQIEEKAELTHSEMEVRGDLKRERAEHALARKRLAETIQEVKAVSELRDQQQQAHFAYKDSLNTERSLHAATRDQLRTEERTHKETRDDLIGTRRSLGQVEERAKSLAAEVSDLKKSIDRAEARAEKSEDNEKALLRQLKAQESQLGQHTESLIRVQAIVDSLYRKEFKRIYMAPGEAPATSGK